MWWQNFADVSHLHNRARSARQHTYPMQHPPHQSLYTQQTYQADWQSAEHDQHEEEEEVVFVLNEEWAARFAATEKRRAKRKMERAAQLKEARQASKRAQHQEPSFVPSSREVRQEMDYGTNGAEVSRLETALDMHFDRITDTCAPKYWPEMPLT
eukprot:c9925_g1_i2.p1 GENE.c9925_g1_i2~~c9925_g1_i2.p1  ORF type:complete len:155 (+),score=20.11 c9925_g1_i2:45-509(+)